MASSYPGSLDSFSTTHAGADSASSPSHAGVHNDLADAINKIEAELGIAPSSSYSTVAARLAALDVSEFNVEDPVYGAVPDEYYSDGVANATTTFTSATANFVSGDVGKEISIWKAGFGQFQTLVTTISSVTNSTTVVLANTAGRSQTSCKFYIARGGDQTSAIQAAIDAAAAAGGGEVVLPGVSYSVTGLVLKNHVTIRGWGIGCKLRQRIGATVPLIRTDYTLNNSAVFWGVKHLMLHGSRDRQSDYSTTLGANYTAGSGTLTLASGAGANVQPAGTLKMSTTKTVSGAASGPARADSGNLITITATSHGYSNGDIVLIKGVLGTTEANGRWTISGVTTNTFDLVGSTFTNTWTSGGTQSAIRDTWLRWISKSGDVLTIYPIGGIEGTGDYSYTSGQAVTIPRNHGIFAYVDPAAGNGTNQDYNDPNGRIENVFLYEIQGDGFHQYGWSVTTIENVSSDLVNNVALRLSFDTWVKNVNLQAGRFGIVITNSQCRLVNATTYSCGSVVNSDGWGILVDQPTAANHIEGNLTFVGCSAQDCYAGGMWIRQADRALVINYTTSSNSRERLGRHSGVKLTSVTNCEVAFSSTDRNATANQTNALAIDVGSVNNNIKILHGPVTGGGTLGPAIQALSAIDKSNNVVINGGGFEPALFGDGTDGDLNYDGTTTILGMAPSSSVYTLTRDIYPQNLTVRTGVTIITAGYRIFARGLVQNSGTIQNNGTAAPAAPTAPSAQSAGYYLPGTQGGAGGSNAVGSQATAATTNNSFGGSGAAGSTATNAGGAQRAVSAPTAAMGGVNAARIYTHAVIGALRTATGTPTWTGFEGGTGGGGGGSTGTTAKGGGGGNGGGVLFLAALAVNNNGTISANGGAGAAGVAGNGTGGGGGGGGGGLVMAFTGYYYGTAPTATKGATGTGGSAGTAGTDGLVIQVGC